MTLVELRGTDADGRRYELIGTVHPPKPPTLVGLTCTTAWLDDHLAAYPAATYHRVFSDNGLPPHDSGKLARLPDTCLPHVSGKGVTVDALNRWLDGLTRPVWLTFHHEPMGDVDPAEYRRMAGELATATRRHPNGTLVQRIMPIVTRYWIDNGGNPEDFWHDEADSYGVDTYLGDPQRQPAYWQPERTFGALAAVARLGVPVAVPELGAARRPDDTDGTGRAAWMHDCVAYLHRLDWPTRTPCLAVGWWSVGGTRLADNTPEAATWRELTDTQGAPR